MIPRMSDMLSRLVKPLLDPAPDPREREGSGREHEELLSRISDARSRVQAVQPRLRSWRSSAGREAASLLEEARRLVEGDNEAAARVVLRRRLVTLDRVSVMDSHLAQIAEEDRILENASVRLESEVAVRAVRYGISVARYDAAEARVTVTEVLAEISEEFSGMVGELSAADERTEDMEARADALDELVEMGVLSAAVCIPGAASQGQRSNEVESLIDQLRNNYDPREEGSQSSEGSCLT